MPEIHIYLAEGHSDNAKRNMMLDITQAAAKHLGLSPDVVTVQIVESVLSNKMKGGKTFLERRAERTKNNVTTGGHGRIQQDNSGG